MSRRTNIFLSVLILVLALSPDALTQTSTAPSGDGSSGNPYQIDSLANLYWITQNSSSWGSNFVQTADIDASSDTSWNSGAGFPVIGNVKYSGAFMGQFDGGGHTITGLYISLSDSTSVGLFAWLYNGGTVKNLGLINVRITGLSGVGGIAARNEFGTVDNCFTTGSVHAVNGTVGGLVGIQYGGVVSNSHSSATVSGSTANIGGLVGNNAEENPSMNYGSSSIANSYATGDVSATGGLCQQVGGLVGTNQYSSQIGNCHATGNVTGASKLGGLVGYNYYIATIDSSYATGNVSGTGQLIGGFVGINDSYCQISHSHSSGNVKSSGYGSGGFAGYNQILSTITNCYSTGIDSGADGAGGFVGENSDAEINQCFSSGAVVGGNFVGGLAGVYYIDESVSGIIITNSYSSDSVNATGDDIGGLIGEVFGTGSVTYCYSRGKVTANDTSTGVGGLIGYNPQYSSSNCFWDTATSGQTASSSGDIAASTTQMKTQSTFTNAGWSSSTWYTDPAVNDGYPYLAWQNAGGTPLPIQLTSVSATVHANEAELRWTTATEVQNAGFEIERKTMTDDQGTAASSSDHQWSKVGFIAGAGSSNAPKAYSFVDKKLKTGTYEYRLKQINQDGTHRYSQEVEVVVQAPKVFALYQNYPNPFNPTTTIEFSITKLSIVDLKIYDLPGREVETLVNGAMNAGIHEVSFDASKLASGIYFYRLQAGNYSAVKKLVLLK